MVYLLDTSVFSHLVRGPEGPASRGIEDPGEEHVMTSIVVAAEMRFEAARRGSKRPSDPVGGVLERIGGVEPAEPAGRRYAEARAHPEAEGAIVGADDLLIASHALALGAVLVSDEEREFARVPNLELENWLRV